jgi:hypothetical protein
MKVTYVPFVQLQQGERFTALDHVGEPWALCVKIGNSCGTGMPSVQTGRTPFDRMTINAVTLEATTNRNGEALAAGQIVSIELSDAVIPEFVREGER